MCSKREAAGLDNRDSALQPSNAEDESEAAGRRSSHTLELGDSRSMVEQSVTAYRLSAMVCSNTSPRSYLNRPISTSPDPRIPKGI